VNLLDRTSPEYPPIPALLLGEMHREPFFLEKHHALDILKFLCYLFLQKEKGKRYPKLLLLLPSSVAEYGTYGRALFSIVLMREQKGDAGNVS
jgi:hypothetical protein